MAATHPLPQLASAGGKNGWIPAQEQLPQQKTPPTAHPAQPGLQENQPQWGGNIPDPLPLIFSFPKATLIPQNMLSTGTPGVVCVPLLSNMIYFAGQIIRLLILWLLL